MNRCLRGRDYGCDFTVTQQAYHQSVNALVCVWACVRVSVSALVNLNALVYVYVASQWTWQMCCPSSVCNTKMPPSPTNGKHTHPATSSPSLPSSCPPHLHNNPPSVFPARAPMSKPNTTDQQLGMQIVSRGKLCAACQLHTWALGWLSVTCVRVPLHLRRATLMTWCRVSLRCTPPHPSACPQPPQPFFPFTHPLPITRRWDSVSPPEGRKGKKLLRGF